MTNRSRGLRSPNRRLAVLYLRATSAHQADRDMAIVSQQHICAWRAHELGAEVADEFVDLGTGLSMKRPGLTALLGRLAELRAQNAEATIYVIVKDHARIARSIEAYSRISWQIDQAGALLNVASIPLAEYEALSGLSLGERMYGQAIEGSRNAKTRSRDHMKNNHQQIRRTEYMSTSYHTNNKSGQEFIAQLHCLIAHLATTEHRHAVRAGIARRRAQVIQPDTGGHHDE